MRINWSLMAICALSLAVPAGAHHSHGNYSDAFADIEGVVREVHLLVPHSWLYIEVTSDAGEDQIWAVEATGRTGLEQVGITRGYLNPGDAVTLRCHPVRDGSNGCLLGFLKAPDGSVKDWDGGNAPPPSDF